MPAVHFIGEIKGCYGFPGSSPPSLFSSSSSSLSSVYLQWKLECCCPGSAAGGPSKFRHLTGATSGRTWLAERKKPAGYGVWNDPFDVEYLCSGVSGWPMMLFHVFESDEYGRVDLGGYGQIRMPTQPGIHKRNVAINRPRGTFRDDLTAFFVGGRPRYDCPDVVLSTDSRYGHDTISMGIVELTINVVFRGFEQLQYVKFSSNNHVSSACDGCAPSHGADGDESDGEGDDERQSNQPDDQTALIAR